MPLRSALAVMTLCFGLFASDMVQLPGGEFMMGSRSAESDERPVHKVTLKAFSIDKHEVTYGEYRKCVSSGGCSPAHYDDGACLIWAAPSFKKVTVPAQYRSDSYPVVCVSWEQARQYCQRVGKRLPTEAEWEYAALAGGKGPYAWGAAAVDANRCPLKQSCPRKTGSYPPNSWNLNDMTGNVWEWTQDRYQIDYYADSTASTNPQGPAVGRYRVIRGGGWYSTSQQLRVSNRHWFSPTHAEVSVGFRCAR